jgi:drug/metabolite transporter (DMT)-like permease
VTATFLTVTALMAFAANSVLCRIALRAGAIDAASFTTVRLASGALTLFLIAGISSAQVMPKLKRGPTAAGLGPAAAGSWTSGVLLFLYAVPFSFAYLSLTAGTGALILFGCVQATMMSAGLASGERLDVLQWGGLVLAVAGLVYLVRPGLAAPPPHAAALMAIAGCAWGAYSLRGRKASRPLADTAGNFLRSVPLAIVVSALALSRIHASRSGLLLAIASGALASGLGYGVWYAALRSLTATRAAIVQLAVPVLASVGGVLFLGERISAQLVIAAAMILGGIMLALSRRQGWT